MSTAPCHWEKFFEEIAKLPQNNYKLNRTKFEPTVTGHLSDTDICPTRTFVRQPVRNFADFCPTRTFVRQSHFKFILKTISHVKGAISGDYR